jgi:hypothetical protein
MVGKTMGNFPMDRTIHDPDKIRSKGSDGGNAKLSDRPSGKLAMWEVRGRSGKLMGALEPASRRGRHAV